MMGHYLVSEILWLTTRDVLTYHTRQVEARVEEMWEGRVELIPASYFLTRPNYTRNRFGHALPGFQAVIFLVSC
jgi:hypothetical protein